MDMFLPLFPMKSVMVLGLDESDLGDRVRDVATRMGLGVKADPQPERNRFTRSDQYSFIRQGIPAVAMKVGVEPGSAEAQIDASVDKGALPRAVGRSAAAVRSQAAVTFTRLVGALSTEVANHPAGRNGRPTSFFRRFVVNY